MITSRYTLLNFIPKNILEQFQYHAFYLYLLEPLLQAFSSSNWQFTSILPLLCLLTITFICDGFQDIRNHRNDATLNEMMFEVWDGSEFRWKKSRQIEVGDIILIKNNDCVPADILLLSVGDDEKVCYVDKTGVMGGTDIKVKKPIKDTQLLFESKNMDKVGVYISKLNAKIKIPESAHKDMCGSIKLSISPNLTEITASNYIQQ